MPPKITLDPFRRSADQFVSARDLTRLHTILTDHASILRYGVPTILGPVLVRYLCRWVIFVHPSPKATHLFITAIPPISQGGRYHYSNDINLYKCYGLSYLLPWESRTLDLPFFKQISKCRIGTGRYRTYVSK